MKRPPTIRKPTAAELVVLNQRLETFMGTLKPYTKARLLEHERFMFGQMLDLEFKYERLREMVGITKAPGGHGRG